MKRESFKDFKRICRGNKVREMKKEKSWWHAVPRFISIYITWILVKTTISANLITIFSIIIGLTGLLLIGLSKSLLIIIGFTFLYIYFILDEVDGEVARYKKSTSVQGVFYDEVGHLLIHTGLFFTFGYSIYRITSVNLFLILGILAAFSILGIRIIRQIPLIASSKGSVKIIIKDEKNDVENKPSKKSFTKILFYIFKNITTAFCTTIIITTTYFVNFLLYIIYDNSKILKLTMISYVIFMFIVFLFFIIARSRTIEKDVTKSYKMMNE